MNTRLLIVLMVIVSVAHADLSDPFILLGGSEVIPSGDTKSYTQGTLRGSSSVDVQSGGFVEDLYAEGDSSVTISGGSVNDLSAYGDSSVSISGGSVVSLTAYNSTEIQLSDGSAENLAAYGSCTVNISGGVVTDTLGGYGDSQIELTGGAITTLDAGGRTVITFYGSGWSASGGLNIMGDVVTGTGILSGDWPDGSDWSTHIRYHDDTATIRLAAPPNPCGECKGKVSELTLLYTGPGASVKVALKGKRGKRRSHHADGCNGSVIFDDHLSTGKPFKLTGTDRGTLGTEILLYINDDLNTKIHTSCSRPIYPGMTSGHFEVVEGVSLKGGLLCERDSEPPNEDCQCEGKVTQLTLLYTGDSTDSIIVTGKGKKHRKTCDPFDGPVIFFEDSDTDLVTEEAHPLYGSGRKFTLFGHDKKGTLGTEISVYVGNELNTKIHTSCSKPMGIGLTFGDFTVIGGHSRRGGSLCVLE